MGLLSRKVGVHHDREPVTPEPDAQVADFGDDMRTVPHEAPTNVRRLFRIAWQGIPAALKPQPPLSEQQAGEIAGQMAELTIDEAVLFEEGERL